MTDHPINLLVNAAAPIICVWLSGIAVIVADAFRSPGDRLPLGVLGVIGLLAAGIASVLLWDQDTPVVGVLTADHFGLFVILVLVLVGVLTVALSPQLIERDEIPSGEYYALTLFAVGGMMLMAAANDLLVLCVALEILSLAVYALTLIRRDSPPAADPAFKHLLLGGFASGCFLGGLALTFGVTGTTRIDQIAIVMSGRAAGQDVISCLALGLLVAGFAFKASAAPFHTWTPDVYDGAPGVVTVFISAGVKVASFAAFARVLMSAFGGLQPQWGPVIWVLSAASMMLGATAGAAARSVRRMLAYAGIEHAGYLLMAMRSGNDAGKSAMLFYLPAYGLASIGAFGVAALLATRDRRHDTFDNYAGLSNRQPLLALLMTIFLLSLGGFPLTAGFVGKWYLFSAAIAAGDHLLAAIGVTTSMVSVVCYLRIVLSFVDNETSTAPVTTPTPASLLALAVPTLSIVYLGILPAGTLDLAIKSIATIL